MTDDAYLSADVMHNMSGLTCYFLTSLYMHYACWLSVLVRHTFICATCRCASLRRNADDLRKSLETVVIPLFCMSQLAVDEERQTKLKKVLLLVLFLHSRLIWVHVLSNCGCTLFPHCH